MLSNLDLVAPRVSIYFYEESTFHLDGFLSLMLQQIFLSVFGKAFFLSFFFSYFNFTGIDKRFIDFLSISILLQYFLLLNEVFRNFLINKDNLFIKFVASPILFGWFCTLFWMLDM